MLLAASTEAFGSADAWARIQSLLVSALVSG
jgi:hypothetical protein